MYVVVVKQKMAYEIEYGLGGSEMCIRDRTDGGDDEEPGSHDGERHLLADIEVPER